MTRIPKDGTGCPCEICGKPVRRGQFVNFYDDIGEAHVDCDRPYAVPKESIPAPEGGGTMPTYVLLGDPMMLFMLAGPGEIVLKPATGDLPLADAGALCPRDNKPCAPDCRPGYCFADSPNRLPEQSDGAPGDDR